MPVSFTNQGCQSSRSSTTTSPESVANAIASPSRLAARAGEDGTGAASGGAGSRATAATESRLTTISLDPRPAKASRTPATVVVQRCAPHGSDSVTPPSGVTTSSVPSVASAANLALGVTCFWSSATRSNSSTPPALSRYSSRRPGASTPMAARTGEVRTLACQVSGARPGSR